MSSRYFSYYTRQDTDSHFNLLEFHSYSPGFENKELGEYSQDKGDILYIAEQENTGFFHYEHWKNGVLLRRLKYNSDYGLISADGEPEQWENFPQSECADFIVLLRTYWHLTD